MKTILKILCVFALFDLSRASGITIIDDFTSGPLAVTLTPASSSLNQRQTGFNPANVVDGHRRILAFLNPPIQQTDTASVAVGSGDFQLQANADLEYYGVSWGLQSLSIGAATLALNENLLAGGNTGFRLDIASLSHSRTARLRLASGVNEGSIKNSAVNVSLTATSVGYSVVVPFGQFSGVDFQNIDFISFDDSLTPPGFELRLHRITLARPGDFDADGDVDGADFVVWQTSFPAVAGHNLATGDADIDGDVDGADFVIWQTNFPYTPSPGAVPEPSTITLALLSVPAIFALRRPLR